jgi:hypothetical protein
MAILHYNLRHTAFVLLKEPNPYTSLCFICRNRFFRSLHQLCITHDILQIGHTNVPLQRPETNNTRYSDAHPRHGITFQWNKSSSLSYPSGRDGNSTTSSARQQTTDHQHEPLRSIFCTNFECCTCFYNNFPSQSTLFVSKCIILLNNHTCIME